MPHSVSVGGFMDRSGMGTLKAATDPHASKRTLIHWNSHRELNVFTYRLEITIGSFL